MCGETGHSGRDRIAESVAGRGPPKRPPIKAAEFPPRSARRAQRKDVIERTSRQATRPPCSNTLDVHCQLVVDRCTSRAMSFFALLAIFAVNRLLRRTCSSRNLTIAATIRQVFQLLRGAFFFVVPVLVIQIRHTFQYTMPTLVLQTGLPLDEPTSRGGRRTSGRADVLESGSGRGSTMPHNRQGSHDPNAARRGSEESGYTPPLTPVSEISRLVMTAFDTPRRMDAVKRPGQLRVLRRNSGGGSGLVPCRRYVRVEQVTDGHTTRNIHAMNARRRESTRFPCGDFSASRDCNDVDGRFPHGAAMRGPDNVLALNPQPGGVVRRDSQAGAAVPRDSSRGRLCYGIHSPGRLCYGIHSPGRLCYGFSVGAAVPHPMMGALHPSPLSN
jgi:hypothetical protein